MLRARAHMLVIAAVALSAPSVARAEARPPYGGELIASLLGEPATLDPVLAQGGAELSLAAMLFDTLYVLDEAGRAVPHAAAARAQPSEDDRVYRIALRAGIRYHDGSEMTADDVARSLERLRASAAGWLFAPIVGVWAEDGAIMVEVASAPIELERLLAAPAAAITPGGRPPKARPSGWTRTEIPRGHSALLPFHGKPRSDSVRVSRSNRRRRPS